LTPKGLLIGVASVVLASAAFAGFGDVVSSFSAPRINLAGLAWDGDYLWFAGQPGKVFLRTTTTGSIVSSFNIGGGYSFIKGLTFDGTYLWYSWKHPQESYYYKKTTTTGSYAGVFGAGGFGPGVTWESPYLWCGPAKFTTGGSFVASFNPPFTLGSDLGWYGHKLWLGGPGNRMYNVTTNGSVVASFPVPAGGEAAGTTFDGQYLWLINATNNWVYQIDIDVVGMNPGSFGKIKGLYR
jgi:hypothetical protein